MPFKPPDIADHVTPPVTGLPARLEQVVERSIEQADHILGLPLDRDHPQYAAELRAKTAVINTTLATQVKVDDLRLKRQGDPKVLERLLAEIAEAKAKNPKLCEPPVCPPDRRQP